MQFAHFKANHSYASQGTQCVTYINILILLCSRNKREKQKIAIGDKQLIQTSWTPQRRFVNLTRKKKGKKNKEGKNETKEWVM